VNDETVDTESTEGVDEGLGDEQPEGDATQTDSETDAPRFNVKVGGQELEVELDELISGYQRQRDYTQKTQELAAERQRLEAADEFWKAVHEDPQGVIEAITEHFAEQLNAEPPDPKDQRLKEVESFVSEQREAEIERQVMAEVNRLQSEYGDFDGDELLEYAIENQIANLEAAYLHRDRAQQRQQREQQRTAAKRTAPPVAGGSRAAGAHGTQQAPVESIRDAIRAALEEHGASSLT
jgi:hypothetical protein